MLAGIISRENGTPWPSLGMTSARWLEQPVRLFVIADLVVTQPGVYFEALMDQRPPIGGDEYPHVVEWNHTYYLEDGHHRLMRAMLTGHRIIYARWLNASA